MCKADPTPFLVYKGEGKPTDGPDLDIQHKCRNYDGLLEAMKQSAAGQISQFIKIAN